MDAVIPDAVLAHLRQLSEQQTVDPLRGGFTVEQYMTATDCTTYRARKDLRHMVRTGVVESRTVSINAAQADELGYLAAGRTTAFYWTG